MTTVVAVAVVVIILLLAVGIVLVGASILAMPFAVGLAFIIRFIKGPPV